MPVNRDKLKPFFSSAKLRWRAAGLVRNIGYSYTATIEFVKRLAIWLNNDRGTPFVQIVTSDDSPGAQIVIENIQKMLGDSTQSFAGYEFRLGDSVNTLKLILRKKEDLNIRILNFSDVTQIASLVSIPQQHIATKEFWEFWMNASGEPQLHGLDLSDTIVLLRTSKKTQEFNEILNSILDEKDRKAIEEYIFDLKHSTLYGVIRAIRAQMNKDYRSNYVENGFVDTSAELDLLILHALEAGADPGWLGYEINNRFQTTISLLDGRPRMIQLAISRRLTDAEQDTLAEEWSHNISASIAFVHRIFDVYDLEKTKERSDT